MLRYCYNLICMTELRFITVKNNFLKIMHAVKLCFSSALSHALNNACTWQDNHKHLLMNK